MKVLLLTPYSPLLRHDHAANDLALPLVTALATVMDVHVYAPNQQNGGLNSWCKDGVTYHAGSAVRRNQFDRLDTYPYVARESWSNRSTNEAIAVANKVHPDVLHAEYFQTSEALLRYRHQARTSITLHDLPGVTASKPSKDIRSVRRWLQRLERIKMQRAGHAIVDNIDGIFVFSERDRVKLGTVRGIVEVTPIGTTPPVAEWVGDRPHVAAFGGAMWRLENEVTATYLAREVMPLVRQRVPDAEFRIFGARPTATVRRLGQEPSVIVVGEIADYDEEFRRAGVTLAPTMVDAGILLKAVRAMSMGCPVVLNSASAGPIVGLEHGRHALVCNSASEIASGIVELMQDSLRARQIGQAAKRLARAQFDWQRTAATYHKVFDRLLCAS